MEVSFYVRLKSWLASSRPIHISFLLSHPPSFKRRGGCRPYSSRSHGNSTAAWPERSEWAGQDGEISLGGLPPSERPSSETQRGSESCPPSSRSRPIRGADAPNYLTCCKLPSSKSPRKAGCGSSRRSRARSPPGIRSAPGSRRNRPQQSRPCRGRPACRASLPP